MTILNIKFDIDNSMLKEDLTSTVEIDFELLSNEKFNKFSNSAGLVISCSLLNETYQIKSQELSGDSSSSSDNPSSVKNSEPNPFLGY